MKIGICVISYNRPESTKRVLNSISQGIYDSDSVDLIISIDNSGSDEVELVARNFCWLNGNKRIITHEKRLGLKTHVLEVGQYTKEYDGLIVLEDDIFVAPSFYLYAKACVQEYCNNPFIAGISLYSFRENYHRAFIPFEPLKSDSDVYLMQNAQSWGQVWMKNQWQEFMEWYNKNSEQFPEMPHLPRSICNWRKSWLKYHTRYCIENNKFFIYPYTSFSTCCNDAGEHVAKADTHLQVPLFHGVKKEYILNPTVMYDSFFENEMIYDIMGMSKKELCVDLYGEKENRMKCRYWLTQRIMPYKVVSSYGLSFRPLENNIILGTSGNEIYLYDTSVVEKNNNKTNISEFLIYLYNYNLGIKSTLKILKSKFLNRFKK